MEWKAYWQDLLYKNRLQDRVAQLDKYEKDLLKRDPLTENICKKVFERYDEKASELLLIKRECMKEFDTIEGIHLSSGRVKSMDSLLCKIINKRWENIAAFDSRYYSLNEFNFDKIITDLIGLKLIIGYRGRWLSVHRKILEVFPILDEAFVAV